MQWFSLTSHGLWQTGFVDETEAAKVDRVKHEKVIFWGPSAKVTVEEAKGSALQVGELLPS